EATSLHKIKTKPQSSCFLYSFPHLLYLFGCISILSSPHIKKEKEIERRSRRRFNSRIPPLTLPYPSSLAVFLDHCHPPLKFMDATRGPLQVLPVDEVVADIMKIHRSLPPRPSIDEVEAANELIQSVDKEEEARLDAINRQRKSPDVPEELFSILVEMQKNSVSFHSNDQKRDALRLLDLENLHFHFDDLIQRASMCLPSSSSSSSSTPNYATTSSKPAAGSSSSKSSFYLSEKQPLGAGDLVTRDDSYMKKAKPLFYSDRAAAAAGIGVREPTILDSTLRSTINASGQDGGDKLSLIKLASLIEVSAKKGATELNLGSKLMDQIDWLPDSIGKLSSLVTLDLSDNRIMVLPPSIAGLSSLTRLDLHSNRIAQLPESFGDLLSLVFLDLRANQLSTLPATIGRLARLEDLDLSSNRLNSLPDSIGSLASLKKLSIETNEVEELPHTIGQCTSLKEFHADYNKLKALPEAVGKIETLEVLSVRYNNIRQLPTTMSSLVNLRELDVSFNELEAVPESLCFATSLVKINVGNNFADLRFLPRSIGNLSNLEELDISNNQIRVLPDSFKLLSRLRVLRVEENPLEMPPRHVADKGAQAVVQFMAEMGEKRDIKIQPVKQKKSWAQICCFPESNKRKRDGMDYVKA
ncbi:Plant intracellular Ras-group-related LRR protein 4, partial [Linum grandiflorum]